MRTIPPKPQRVDHNTVSAVRWIKSENKSTSLILNDEYENHTKNHRMISPKNTALMVDYESFRTGSSKK
jgi:hypothetical protein